MNSTLLLRCHCALEIHILAVNGTTENMVELVNSKPHTLHLALMIRLRKNRGISVIRVAIQVNFNSSTLFGHKHISWQYSCPAIAFYHYKNTMKLFWVQIIYLWLPVLPTPYLTWSKPLCNFCLYLHNYAQIFRKSWIIRSLFLQTFVINTVELSQSLRKPKHCAFTSSKLCQRFQSGRAETMLGFQHATIFAITFAAIFKCNNNAIVFKTQRRFINIYKICHKIWSKSVHFSPNSMQYFQQQDETINFFVMLKDNLSQVISLRAVGFQRLIYPTLA